MYIPIFTPQIQVVPGTHKQTHVICFPEPSQMFQDETRSSIVQLSLSANCDFVRASGLHKDDPARAPTLHLAMGKRLREKERWLALEPPDQLGAWQAELAMASYHSQLGDMTTAFNVLLEIRKCAPTSSEVFRLANHNLVSMRNQARKFLPDHVLYSDTPTTDELEVVGKFWEYYMQLPDA